MEILIKTVSWTLNQSYKWARTEVPKSLMMYGLFFIKEENVLFAYKQDSPTSKNRVSHMIWYPWVFWKISNMIDFIDKFSRIVPKNVKLCRNIGNWWDKNHIYSYWPLIGHTEESN